MEERTIFHKIRDREVPADIMYEDSEVLVFRDIRPKMKTHLLFIPRKFIASVKDLTEETAHLPGMLVYKAKQFADMHGIDGYQLKFHVGASGGQEVMYLHLHFLSDQSTSPPLRL